MNIGAIAIGSNSTRMLTRLGDGREDRAREDTRLFAGLDDKGNLSDEAMDRTVRAVHSLKMRALAFGADRVLLLATSASRDAGNSEEFARRLFVGTGLRLRIITGPEEAALAFKAASQGRHCAVLDIGGGSAELIYGVGGEIGQSVSAQEGASRLLRAGEITSLEEADRLRLAVMDRLKAAYAPLLSIPAPPEMVSIGGTATTAAAIRLQTESHGQELEGTVLTLDDVRGQLSMLAPMTLEERARVPGLYPSRVHIMPHGLCILLAVMELTGYQRLSVSTRNNLDAVVTDPGWAARAIPEGTDPNDPAR